jgi:hypothetical protein
MRLPDLLLSALRVIKVVFMAVVLMVALMAIWYQSLHWVDKMLRWLL